jgi:hypothetical protein
VFVPRWDRLQVATAVFVAALVVHGIDHTRRGFDVITNWVLAAGTLQNTLAVITIVLVVRRHSLAPTMATAVGFASAIGFTAAHLLPHWSGLSDSFTGSAVAPHVTGLSWFAALFEIAADLWLGVEGLRAWRRTSVSAPV